MGIGHSHDIGMRVLPDLPRNSCDLLCPMWVRWEWTHLLELMWRHNQRSSRLLDYCPVIFPAPRNFILSWFITHTMKKSFKIKKKKSQGVAEIEGTSNDIHEKKKSHIYLWDTSLVSWVCIVTLPLQKVSTHGIRREIWD